MQKFKEKSVNTLSAYVCDKCGKEAILGNNDNEAQEFISIRHRAGYASIFGDHKDLCLDLCQHCFKETLGTWVKVKEPNNSEII